MRILVTRPEPDATEQAALLRERGHDVMISPLLEATLLPTPSLEGTGSHTAMIVTSRNALRALEQGGVPDHLADKPMFCVGSRTAEMASSIGFKDVRCGESDGAALAELVQNCETPGTGTILRLMGDVPSNAPNEISTSLRNAGYDVADITCYRARLHPEFSPPVRAALEHGDIDLVILMSPLTAKSFVQAHTSAGLTLRSDKPRYVCLSKAVAGELVGFPQSSKLIADKPNQSGLLSVVDHAVAQLS